MKGQDYLRDSLSRLRNDKQLREHLAAAVGILRHEQWLLSHTEPSIVYQRAIHNALHRLASYVGTYFRDCSGDGSSEPRAALLLGYASAFGFPRSRISDYKIDALTAASNTLAMHFETVLQDKNRGWQYLLQQPTRIEIHELAQRRIRKGAGQPKRAPVYICPCAGLSEADPIWPTQPSLTLDGPFVLDETSLHVATLLKLPISIDPTGSAAALLKIFKTISEFEEPSDGQPNPNSELALDQYLAYVNYLQLLLTNSKESYCLCTIAIADELTNTRLGTAMMLSPEPIRLPVAEGIHDLCYEVFDAIYKSETETFHRQTTTLLITRWINHEANAWQRMIRGVKKQLLGQPSDNPKWGELGDDLEAIATAIPRSTELLAQFAGSPEAFVSPAEFESDVRKVYRAYGPRSGTLKCEVGIEDDIPSSLALVCVELIRNATNHRDQYTEEFNLSISLRGSNDELLLTVTSEPQDEQKCRVIDRILVSCDPMASAGERLGVNLTSKVAQILGGSMAWDVRQKNGKYSVTVTCRIPNLLKGGMV